MNTLILINAMANKGKAKNRWHSIRDKVLGQIPGDTDEFIFYPGDNLYQTLKNYNQVKCFISAGGDGSVNHLVNCLMNTKGPKLQHISIGGIGLGSSNDFIKPCKTWIGTIPVRINFDEVNAHDLGVVTYRNSNGKLYTRYFIINASIGALAEANLFFNRGDNFLNWLKKWSVQKAILYAAIRTILVYKKIPVLLSLNSKEFFQDISNLSVIKNRHISGSFHYDQPVLQADGNLGLNYCIDLSTPELIGTLIDLNKGVFSGKRKRYSKYVQNLHIKSEKDIAVETDGEVFRAHDIQFSIIPSALNVLGF
jgi:diacylglycerol kinase family enzyme